MAALGPFGPAPHLAAGVSGGPDSMALALLADRWARDNGGSLVALIVDHGLRPESCQEAALAAARLAERGIQAQLLPITGLLRGPALAERARRARFAVLETACREAGIVHLLLGHHAADQAETVLMRSLSDSGPVGMAGMLPLLELAWLRLLRPLLMFPPARLRATLAAARVECIEDPSNMDAAALRPRLRMLRRDRDGIGGATAALLATATAAARRRAARETAAAAALAEEVVVRPEGYSVLSGRPVSSDVLAAVLQALSGAAYPPAPRSVTAVAAALRPATLAGVQLLPAGRLGPGLLAVREAAAMALPIVAQPDTIWDGRFRLLGDSSVPSGAMLGALGRDAAQFREFSPLPSAVLRTLPAVRVGARIHAVPHLGFPDRRTCESLSLLFCPPRAAAPPSFPFGDA
jgi:tRNA(Ile)-lysidine synthase